MAKNSTAARKSEAGTAKAKPKAKLKDTKEKRYFLYPLEPTSIDPERIKAAVLAVIAERKNK